MPHNSTTRTSSRRSPGAGNTINKLVPSSWARGPHDGTRRANIVGRREREVVVEGFDSLPLRRDDVVRGLRRVLLEIGELVPQELDLVQGVVAVPVWKLVGRPKSDFHTETGMYWIVCFELGGVPPSRYKFARSESPFS